VSGDIPATCYFSREYTCRVDAYLEVGLGQELGKEGGFTPICPSPYRAEQHSSVPGPVRGPRKQPQYPQSPQWFQQPLPHGGAACGQLGFIL
jgi:hypothetical protein